ncbi:hypothetical protein C0995_004510 [Termitomyces sp. Mi166|nr:hypothetical protein C0995_004510 [Termitomyces sp. Mi166\
MAPLQLSMISDRLEIMLGAVGSSITLGNRHGHGQGVISKVQVRWRLHRPCTQRMAIQPRQSKRRITDLERYSLSSIEDTDDSETLASEGASQASYSYYPLPSIPLTLPPQPQTAHVFTGNKKIVPNIADFNCDADKEGTSDTEADTYYSYEGTQPGSPMNLEASPKPVWAAEHPMLKAAPARELIECVTALSPPPLHHSGRTRSKVVSIPRDSPGTCP